MLTVLIVLLAAVFLIGKGENFYMIMRVKRRKKEKLLPDYKQIELLRVGLSERGVRGATDFFLPDSKETVLSEAKMEELKQYILCNDFDSAWEIVDSMISNYERGTFAVGAGILAMIIVVFVIAKLFL